MATTEGTFVWYELTTTDVASAWAFYGAVAGWHVADAGMAGTRYGVASLGERPVAGIMARPAGRDDIPTAWIGYIGVPDVDVTAQRVAEAGGIVHRPPADIAGIGRFAVVADPQGAAFVLFRGGGTAAPDLAPGTPGSVGWHELRTTDWRVAFAFYGNLFGWQAAYAHDMGPMGIYQTFSAGGVWTGGMMTSAEADRPHWLFYIAVDDIDAAVARVTTAGGTVQGGPHPVPGDSWVAMVTDPQGARFGLTGRRQA